MHITRALPGLALAVLTAVSATACVSSSTSTSTSGGSATSGAHEVAADIDLLTVDDFATLTQRAPDLAGTVALSITTTALGDPVTMDAEVRTRRDGDPDLRVYLAVDGYDPLDLRMVDSTLYVSDGSRTEGGFVAVDPTDVTSSYVTTYQQLADQTDTFLHLTMLDAGVLAVDAVGAPVTMDGVEVQQYDVVLDGAALAAAEGSILPAEVTFTYWIDADHLWHRVTADVDGVTVTSTAHGWGEPVEIEAPAPEELIEG
ncbi:MAG TPA: hypothetical protein VGC67_16940 [Cellulomonas sp.]